MFTKGKEIRRSFAPNATEELSSVPEDENLGGPVTPQKTPAESSATAAARKAQLETAPTVLSSPTMAREVIHAASDEESRSNSLSSASEGGVVINNITLADARTLQASLYRLDQLDGPWEASSRIDKMGKHFNVKLIASEWNTWLKQLRKAIIITESAVAFESEDTADFGNPLLLAWQQFWINKLIELIPASAGVKLLTSPHVIMARVTSIYAAESAKRRVSVITSFCQHQPATTASLHDYLVEHDARLAALRNNVAVGSETMQMAQGLFLANVTKINTTLGNQIIKLVSSYCNYDTARLTVYSESTCSILTRAEPLIFPSAEAHG